jgi:23S rRNA (cytosine1962-C5)-methyltransferase
MTKARVVTLNAGAAAAVLRGHPWVWREGVARAPQGLEMGDPVELRDPKGTALGQALWDPSSPIGARVYVRDTSVPLGSSAIVEALERAIERRKLLASDPSTTAYRLCNGEGDRVPGVVLDRYDDVAVLRLDGEAIVRWLDDLADGVWALLAARGVRSLGLRASRRDADVRLESLRGEAPPPTVTVRENGMAMIVDLAHGQKTGAFLDQRDNRARVRGLARGKRVLNLFSYAGGFSIAAALGGSLRTTSVDLAQPAHATAQRSMRANDIDPGEHAFVTGDTFAFLEAAKVRRETWDLVVSDPPSFAPSEKARPRAITAYRKLHAACAAVLAKGGILCASSCSSHVPAEDFAATLDDATLGRNDLSLVGLYGSPSDHPTLPAWPEGRYLKFAILR